MNNETYRALEHAAERSYPGSTVLPGMLTGYTDMALLRAKSIQSYGIGPLLTRDDQPNFGAHSDVERVLKSSLYKLVESTWDAVTAVAVHK